MKSGVSIGKRKGDMTREEMITEFLSYKTNLSRYIYRLGMVEYVEDILQDVAIRIWAGSEFRGTSGIQFKSWIKIIVMHRVFELKRGEKNKKHLNIEDLRGVLVSREEGIEHNLYVREELEEFRKLAESLPAMYKIAVIRYMDNWGRLVVPDGIPISRYKAQQHRGIGMLKKIRKEGG